jgi:small neutral amino acid transporter SnatA (MarC family)
MMRLCSFGIVIAVLLVWLCANIVMLHRAWIDNSSPITLINLTYEMVSLVFVALGVKVGQGIWVEKNKPEQNIAEDK